MVAVQVTERSVSFEGLESRDPEVVHFFSELPTESLDDMALRALTVGVTGLRAMGTAGRMEVVEKEFLKLSQSFNTSLAGIERSLLERIDRTFDPGRAESVSARLTQTIAQANRVTTTTIDAAKAELERLIAESFNPELTTSCVYKIIKKMDDTEAELDRSFDPSVEGSHLFRLVSELATFFGEDGKIGEVIGSQISPVKEELLNTLQSLRDALVGQTAATQIPKTVPIP
jgi:hypothetical protein